MVKVFEAFKNKLAFPVLGSLFDSKDYAEIDLSTGNPDLNELVYPHELDNYIQDFKNNNGAKVAYGGYLEQRNLYKQSLHFAKQDIERDVHLGIDLWTNPGHLVYNPFDALVHSFKYNGMKLDYGYTIILEHKLYHYTFYTLYGHLGKDSFLNLYNLKEIKKGEAFAEIGPMEENGGWIPHLHVQLILDISGWKGDYPGVCSVKDKNYFENNCPNPLFLIFPDYDAI